MRKSLLIFSLFLLTISMSAATRFVTAQDPAVTFTGRIQKLQDGAVRYDWVGVYAQLAFTGPSINVDISETGRSLHHVFIDGKWVKKIEVTGKDRHTVVLATGLKGGQHTLKLQRCTEGEYGCTTLYGFNVSHSSKLAAVPRKERLIEVFGDSYSAGFGAYAPKKDWKFKLEEEDVNRAYESVVARYFDADLVVEAHSGRGIVRNIFDKAQTSKKTMGTRASLVFDDADTISYKFDQYKPDLVLINLGTNDFSDPSVPRPNQYVKGMLDLINLLRSHFPDVKVICVMPHTANDYLTLAMNQLRERIRGMKGVYMTHPMNNVLADPKDYGAGHPNVVGHRKIAMTLIPLVSTVMDWPLNDRAVE